MKVMFRQKLYCTKSLTALALKTFFLFVSAPKHHKWEEGFKITFCSNIHLHRPYGEINDFQALFLTLHGFEENTGINFELLHCRNNPSPSPGGDNLGGEG